MIKPVENHGSFAKKAAAVVGVAAVAGSAIYALKKGQLPDTFEGGKAKQIAATLGDGYKKLGGELLELGKKGVAKVKEKAPKVLETIKEKANEFAAKFRPAAEAAEELAGDVIA